jgi:hypothetical protein
MPKAAKRTGKKGEGTIQLEVRKGIAVDAAEQ